VIVASRISVALAAAVLLLGCERIAGLREHVLALPRDAGAEAAAAPDGAVPGTASPDGPPDGRVDVADAAPPVDVADAAPPVDVADAAPPVDVADAESPVVGADAPPASCTPAGQSDPTCATGLDTCGGASCAVNLATDRNHCGECGHSCGDGQCLDRQCQPRVLADGLRLAHRRMIAVGPGGVYWGTTDGSLVHLPHGEEASAATILASGEGDIRELVLDAGFAYAIVADGKCGGGWCLRRIPLTAGAPGTETLSAVGHFSGGLSIDARNVYWYDTASGGSIFRLAIRGTTAPERQPIAQEQGQFTTDLAIDETHVYWGTLTSDVPASTIRRARLDGTLAATPEPIADRLVRPYALTIDRWNIYWAESGDGPRSGAIKMKPKLGGAITTLADNELYPVEIAVDEANVYWGAQLNLHPGIHRVPLCGGVPRGPRLVAAGGRGAGGIITWQGQVYCNDEKTVFRFAR
jgi:hypothetical protein